MMTVREAYMRTVSLLHKHQVDDANGTAEILLKHVLCVSRTRLLALWSDPIDTVACEGLWACLARRCAGEPVEYIVGEVEFAGRSFDVSPHVLIPRPETEQLVRCMVERGRMQWGERPIRVLDLGTGSGVIAITVAKACATWHVHAVDRSRHALDIAQKNAQRHCVASQITWHEGDWLTGCVGESLVYEASPAGEREIHMLIANPPYIPTKDIPHLQREVCDYEPEGALDGGQDGLDAYRTIVAQMKKMDFFPHVVGFEVGMHQAQAVAQLLDSCAVWSSIDIQCDFADIERYVYAQR